MFFDNSNKMSISIVHIEHTLKYVIEKYLKNQMKKSHWRCFAIHLQFYLHRKINKKIIANEYHSIGMILC